MQNAMAGRASVSGIAAEGRDPKRRVLKDVFGFDDFRPGQADVIETLLCGRHVLAVMPTGAGKSLCYQVPALVLGGLTIVVSPLVALMQDQVAALRLAGVAATWSC
ncbi:DEAD/DEAH box helicase, partial [Mesorhizobium sp.]|uniref:DEAD/DEAH box helicase n=1 Tax=Mesorhizobium sp. TaxID=1871066 RepID=UPI0025BCE567